MRNGTFFIYYSRQLAFTDPAIWELMIMFNTKTKKPMDQEGRVAHSQLFTHYTRYQEVGQPLISPRRHVYVTMVHETMLEYSSEVICTAAAQCRREIGKVPREDCTKGGDGGTTSELRREYNLAWKF